MTPHRRYKGSTGSGKTNAATVDLLELAERGDYWITAVFPHPQMGEKFIAELYCLYGEQLFNRLIVERLQDTDKVIMRQYIHSSDDPDPYQKRIQDDEYRNAFISMLLPSQGATSLSEQPWKYKYTNLAVAVKQNQRVWWPESFLPYLLENHPDHNFARTNCTDEQLNWELDQLIKMPAKERFMGPGSASRLMDTVLGNPVMQVRACKQESFDWVHFKNSGGIHVILGGNTSSDAMKVHVGSDFQRTVRDAKNRALRPGVYFIDEATNYGLYGDFESSALSTVRAFGLSMWHAIQSENYATPEIARNVAQNVDDHIFRQSDPDEAYRAARTLNGARDRFRVHHEDVTIRSVDTGEFDIKKRKGVTKGKAGKTESESEQLIPIRRDEEVRTPRYDNLGEQTEYMSQVLMQLNPGRCWINPRDRAPFELQVKLFPDSWAFSGLAQDKAIECIRILKTQAPYETPVSVEFPTMPSQESAMRKRKGS